MAEFIEREALLLRIDCHGTNKFGMLDEDIRAFVKAQPAADVAPVVHGEWIDNGIPESILCGCSVCGFTCGASSFFYCPNCGAKMDGGTEENKGGTSRCLS